MKRILKTNALMGASTIINIATGVLRSKFLALWVGKEGVGLYGLLTTLMSTAASVAGMGLSAVMVRDGARLQNEEDADDLKLLFEAMGAGAAIAGLLGAIAMYIWREELAVWALKDATLTALVVMVGFSLPIYNLGQLSTAWINAHGETTKVATVYVWTSLLWTIGLIASVLVWGLEGVIWGALAIPIARIIASLWQSRTMRPTSTRTYGPRALVRRVSQAVPLGVSLTAGSFVEHTGNLTARSIILDWGSKDAVGLFHAASAIVAMYNGFIISAMTVDYYPRLSAATSNEERVDMVNEQLYVSWLLILPALLGLYVVAPVLLWILYSADFAKAQGVLQWILLADVPKIPRWAFGYVFITMGFGKTYLLTQVLLMGSFLGFMFWGLPVLGLEASGMAFVVSNALLMGLMWVALRYLIGFRFERRNLVLGGLGVASGASMVALELWVAEPWSTIGQALVALLVGGRCLMILLREFEEVLARVPFFGARLVRLVQRFGRE